MLVNLAYGRTGLTVEFPDDRTTVIEPTYLEGLPDQRDAVRAALEHPNGTAPLRDLVSAGQTVAISVCDITRPMPSVTVLPVVLDALAHVPTNQIAVLIASGTHRATTHDELVEMLGKAVVDRYRIVVHDAFDETQLVSLGEVENRIPVWLNRTGWRPTSGSPPASSSRTSSPVSAAVPRWSHPDWRGSTRSCDCMTPR